MKTTAEFEHWINNLSEEEVANLYKAAENIKVAKVKTRDLPSRRKPKDVEPYVSIDEEPFVTLENGNLVCNELKFSEPCTVTSCRLLGVRLFETNHQTWLCSSSLDFPQEQGIEITEIHELIQKGFEQGR
jgi:hypothetical protein